MTSEREYVILYSHSETSSWGKVEYHLAPFPLFYRLFWISAPNPKGFKQFRYHINSLWDRNDLAGLFKPLFLGSYWIAICKPKTFTYESRSTYIKNSSAKCPTASAPNSS